MRRYIGERYVPIVDGAWDITKTYEPLTMVSNSNNIYISKNYVPAGVNISDTDYWALMMDYSAIISDVNDLSDNVNKSLSDETNYNGYSLNDAIQAIATEMDDRTNKVFNTVVSTGVPAGGFISKYSSTNWTALVVLISGAALNGVLIKYTMSAGVLYRTNGDMSVIGDAV